MWDENSLSKDWNEQRPHLEEDFKEIEIVISSNLNGDTTGRLLVFMFLCYVLQRVTLVLEFQSARTTSQCSFQVLEEYVALHTFPASHLSSTESASVFIFRKVKRSVVLCCLQRSHSGQTGCSVAVKVHQATRKWAEPVQRIERISKLIEDKKFCKKKRR